MNWLGDLWAYPFHASVWGTAGQWIGSILTGGSLLLGFKIMRTNQKDKRREQASLVVFTNYYTSSLGEDGDIMPLVTIRGAVHNHSSALVTGARIEIEMKKGVARQRLPMFDRWFRPRRKIVASTRLQVEDDITCTILPSTDIRYVLHLPDDAHIAAEEVNIKLTFMDANSVTWERPFMGAPKEATTSGRIRAELIDRIAWRDWEKANPDDETPAVSAEND